MDYFILVKLQCKMIKNLGILLTIMIGLIMVFTQPSRADWVDSVTQSITPNTASPSPSVTFGTPQPTQSPTIGPSPTLLTTPTETATTTLIPLPEITLIFPIPTNTPTPTRTPINSQLSQTPQSTDDTGVNHLSTRLRFLVAIIIVLWVFLMGFAIIYIRQLR